MGEDGATDYKVARAQFIKSKRAEVRLRYALMADAEIARSVSTWGLQFDARFLKERPQVLDLRSELRRLQAGEPE